MALTQLPPLSLYIHIPWCVKKCPYCDFNSHQVKNDIPEQAYIDRLLVDLEQEIPQVWGRQLSSIFIGGGTPSLFSAQGFEKLLSGIRALLPFQPDMEITMEANPGTVEAQKFKDFFNAGINRISIGVQSFNNQFLDTLGRIHNGDEATRAFEIARQAGFDNINLDLMYALPNQSDSQAMVDLQKAVALSPEHLSWYQLTLEPNTLFYHQPPPIPDEDSAFDISEQGIEFLRQNGYQQYEVSAYSKNGKHPSVHNLNYWQFGDYLGIGAGAHGKISRADDQTITRKSKKRSPKDYLDADKPIIENARTIPQQELPLEFMMNAMRLKNGVAQELFFGTTGLLIGQVKNAISQAQEQGLLNCSNNQLQPSEQGYRFLNELLAYFMPENFPELAEPNNGKVDKANTIKVTELN
ncbi:radical SAM family heme chaperone HemW [Aliikangiella coralliicola]|uniref:Heme chaperone HemW n=1 Tax=Aliikangiella coralliicola TaxID=2592383 RepID=A0A545U7B5_9GAMM|nr:radical SAM family heme chaperone HemW [Aliikangiella coralliicola]TQV85361.1 radical SAM family heme chaperone HemW [Aliikangiella coralliicola]